MPKKHTKGQEAKTSNDKPKPLSEIVVKPSLCSEVTSKVENVKKDKKRFKWAKGKGDFKYSAIF